MIPEFSKSKINLPGRSLRNSMAFMGIVLIGFLQLFAINVVYVGSAHGQKAKSGLAVQIDGLLNRKSIQKTRMSILVQSLADGKTIYEKNPDLRLHPASNTKIITAASALDILGPNFRWETQLVANQIKKGIADNLYLVGRGDPRFVNESLWALIRESKKNGLKGVKGNLVVDDTYFTSERMPPGFGDKDQDSAYRAPSGAMSLNFNSVVITIRPGRKAGQKPRVIIRPDSGHLSIVNQARTTQSGREQLTLRASAKGDRTQITLGGRIPIKHRGLSVRRRIDNPPLFAGDAAKLFLKQAGIRVKGKVKIGKAPSKHKRLARRRSRPLAVIIRDVNKISNNFMAEQLVRTMGVFKKKKGDWASGIQVVKEHLKARYKIDGFEIVNGSGLFGKTAFSARDFTTILRGIAQRTPPLPEFASSLAISGIDGTLRKRFKSVPKGVVRAKTGTLDGVVCLSGYFYTKDGQTLVFSFLANNVPGKAWAVWRIHEEMLRILGGYPDPGK